MDNVKYTPDNIKLNVEIDGTAMLIVTNTYSPYWRVLVNEIESKIVPAYHTFWGVHIESGINEINFIYDPPYKNY